MVPGHSTFLGACDLIIMPLSPSDADVFASSECLSDVNDMLNRREQGKRRPPILLLPNVVDSGIEVAELERAMEPPTPISESLFCTTLCSVKRFGQTSSDRSVLALIQGQIRYVDWLLDVILSSPTMEPFPIGFVNENPIPAHGLQRFIGAQSFLESSAPTPQASRVFENLAV